MATALAGPFVTAQEKPSGDVITRFETEFTATNSAPFQATAALLLDGVDCAAQDVPFVDVITEPDAPGTATNSEPFQAMPL